MIATGVALYRVWRRFDPSTDGVAFPGEKRLDLHVVLPMRARLLVAYFSDQSSGKDDIR